MDSPNHLEQRPPGVYELALAEEEARRRRAIARLDEQAIAARLGGNRYLMAWYQGLHGGRQTIQPFDGGQGLLLDRLIGNVQISPLLPSPPHTSTYLPNLVDLDIYRGDDIDLRLVVTNQDGTPADLTVDTSVRAQIRSAPDDPEVLGSFLTFIDPTVPDIIRLKLPRTVTANLPPLCVWDCEVEQGKAAVPPVAVGEAWRYTIGNPAVTIGTTIPAGEWLVLATTNYDQWIISQITDTVGNAWNAYYPPGWNVGASGRSIAFYQCQAQYPITPGTRVPLRETTVWSDARIIWIPGATSSVAAFSGAQGSAGPPSFTDPIGQPGQMILAYSRVHRNGGTPQWLPDSLTTQLGQVMGQTATNGDGFLLTGANLPSVNPAVLSSTWPTTSAWSLTALALDVALPWTTTITAGTITTTPDVTRY